MAYCPKCGAESTGGSFCARCGAPLSGEVSSTGSVFVASNEQSQTQTQLAVDPAADPSTYKLGWHKFLIYFSLWLSALINIGTAIMLLQYSQYSTYFAVLGLLGLAIGIFAIYVRFQLAKFKKGAPKKLLALYIIDASIGIIALLINLGAGVYDNNSASLVVSIAMVFINWRYYSSREALFIN